MALFLKQSTAAVVSFGPFLDKTDGVTEETGLVSALDHATTGIKLSKNGGALTIRHATVTATTYDAYGMYRVTLDTTDTGTLGTLRMAFNEAATCLPVWQDFMVLPANVYDSLVGGSDYLDVSAVQLAGQTITAAAGVTFPSSVASPTNITAAAGIAVSSIGDNVITAASIAADAITDAKVASDVTIASVTGAVGSVTGAVGSVTGNVGGNVTGSVGSVVGAVGSVTGLTAANLDVAVSTRLATAGYTAPPSAAANASQVRTELTTELARIDVATSTRLASASYTAPLDAAGVRSAVGLASANLDTQLGAIPAGVWQLEFAPLVATDNAAEKINGINTAVDDVMSRLGAPVGASISADIATADAVADAIKVKTDYLPSATAGAAGGVFIAGANAATSVATAFTANIAGSMSGNVEGNVNGSVNNVVGNVAGSVGSVVGFTPSNIADIISTLGNPDGASVSADIAAVRYDAAQIKGATFDTATDSLEAIRDRGDAAWDTATGFSTLDAAGVRSAVGLATANLDTQLTTIDDFLDTEVAAIKAKTDLIPASPSSLDAAGVRAAVGLAAANLDTQLATIDSNVDGIKAVTDAGVTLADGAITDAKIAEVAFMGKHFDSDIEIASVAGAVGSVTAGVTVTTNNDKTGYALTSGERNSTADAFLDRTDGAVTGKTLREALSVILSALGGKVSGAGTTTITFRHINDTKDVIVATVDTSGNRTAVTITP